MPGNGGISDEAWFYAIIDDKYSLIYINVMEEIVKNISSIPNDNQHIIGLADLEGILSCSYKEYRYALIIAKKLDDKIIESIKNGPNIEYYELYKDTNDYLSGLVERISKELNVIGIDATAIRPTMSDNKLSKKYQDTLRTDFSHKMAGTRAGIGWIGKTDLLITKKFGPRVRLATVLTKTPIGKCGPPIDRSRCGKCNICIEECPAKAGNGLSWDVTIDRDEFYNPFKCREFCKTISKKNINQDISLCGICISVCPVGKSTSPAPPPISLNS